MLIILTHVVGEAPKTERSPDSDLLKVKSGVMLRAEQLQNAKKDFHLIVADETDVNEVYLEIYTELGCLRKPGTRPDA